MIRTLFQNRVVKNFSYLTIGSAIAQIISFITVLKVTRILAPDDYGLFTFMAAQGLLITTIGDLGIRNIVIRSIARNYERTNDLVFNGIILRALALIVVSFLYVAYNYFLGSLTQEQLILIFVFSFINCFSNLFENAFIGHEKMLPVSLVGIVHSVLWFLAVYTLPAEMLTPNFLFTIFLGLHLAKAAILFGFLKRYGLFVGKVQNFWNSSKTLLKESWPYFALILVMMPFTRFSNNFLDINSTIDEVGYFNLAQKLIGPVSMVLDFALAAIFPNLSALWVKDKGKFNQFISSGFQYFMLIGLVLCFLFSLFVPEVVRLLFSANYQPAILVCQMQIWYLFLTSLDSFVGTILGATNKEKIILRLGIVNATVATPILFFGSQYGALGLSYGYVISFGLFQFYLWYVFRKSLKIKVVGSTYIWLLFVLLFGLTYLIGPGESMMLLGIKVLIALVIIGGSAIYFLRTYKLALAT